jgi:hypothetical protein
VMTSPDSASANYEDRCSNGRNIDNVNRDKFIELMLADNSRFAHLKRS